MPPPSRSERNATTPPLGEIEGSWSSAGSFVSLSGVPPFTCCIQICKLP